MEETAKVVEYREQMEERSEAVVGCPETVNDWQVVVFGFYVTVESPVSTKIWIYAWIMSINNEGDRETECMREYLSNEWLFL